jgi:hypothetical protein
LPPASGNEESAYRCVTVSMLQHLRFVIYRSVIGALSATLLALPAASAADWKVLYSGHDMTIKVDAASIEQRGGALVALQEVSFANEQTDKDHPSPYKSEVELLAYDCASGKVSGLELTEYSAPAEQGRVVAKGNSGGKYAWVHAAPGSIPDFGLKYVCSHVPSAVRAEAVSPPGGVADGSRIVADNQLDKPVASQPTVRSEIKRGFDVAGQCIHFLGGDPLEFEGCITQLEHKSRESLVDPRPFDAGIYLDAWILLDARGNAGDSASRMYRLFRNAQGKLGVSDRQAVHAIGESKDWEDKVISSFPQAR